jgi:hypothetical protein
MLSQEEGLYAYNMQNIVEKHFSINIDQAKPGESPVK